MSLLSVGAWQQGVGAEGVLDGLHSGRDGCLPMLGTVPVTDIYAQVHKYHSALINEVVSISQVINCKGIIQSSLLQECNTIGRCHIARYERT